MDGYILFFDEIFYRFFYKNGKTNECGSDGCGDVKC